MDRTELLATIRKVSPALGGKSFLPILTHLCLDGESVVAYDDIVALKTPCKLGFTGAVPGDALVSLLALSRASTVECSSEDSTVTFKMGRTKAKFAVLPESDFVFHEPDLDGDSIDINTALRTAFGIASKSAGQDAAFPDRLGITLVFGKKKLTLFASDNVTVVQVVLNHTTPSLAGKSFILQQRFYDLLLGLGVDTKLLFTEAGDAVGRSADLQLFGKVRQGANPEQFQSIFESIKLDSVPMADVPAGLARCMQRALVVGKDSTFTYADGRLAIVTESGGCEVRDSLAIDIGSEPVAGITSAERISRYLDVATRIGFCSRCFVLSGSGFTALVGVKAVE